ncbi:Thymidylate kinase [Neochlamydia sp. EPS4]|uniref:dTMP kinase n=1 Tax=Neochlamydia sp. EPS4 TaxID=1478175 RepID=UPI000583099E|nr:dTMP kinase [Neochlamydia sp. EPS4]KIC73845.1 Thymidylate kinase [Neochlamydia sp. EPS4]
MTLFITIEGGEGAGKTTLIEKLAAVLTSFGYAVVKTREPGGSRLSTHIREWLLNRNADLPIGYKAELLLFLAARAQHLEELIRPALEKGKVVLCDRFNDSTIVYQGIGRGLGMDYVKQICECVSENLNPDLTLFLDVDPQIGLMRTRKASKENAGRGEVDRIEAERLDFHKRVRQGFLSLARQSPERIRVIDANQAEDAVFRQAKQWLEEKVIH